MADPVAQGIEQLNPADIQIKSRMRPVQESAVDALQASFEEVGRLVNPVQVRRTKKGDVLIDGAHRLALALRLGWAEIPAQVWRCNDTHAQIIELDGNLVGAELNTLDMAVFLAKRKRIYVELYPASAAGRAGATARWEGATDIVSFAKAIAEARGITARHVRRLTAIGESLTDTQITALRQAAGDVLQKDLIALSKANDKQREAAIKAFASGKQAKLSDAVKLAIKPPATSSEKDADDGFDALHRAFKAASEVGRRRFTKKHGTALAALLGVVE